MQRTKDDPRIQLLCEWEGCTRQHFADNYDLFKQHVRTHAKKAVQTTEVDDLTCLWLKCGETTFASAENYCFHVNYHSFHMKLMCYGQICVQDLSKQFARPLDCNNDGNARTQLPDMPDKWFCCWDSCPRFFVEVDPYFDHVVSHIPDGISKKPDGQTVAKCKWTDCRFETKSRARLRIHLRTHTLEKEIACPVCGFMFADRQKFADHILRQVKLSPDDENRESMSETSPPAKKGKREPAQCNVCNEKFLTNRLRDEHRRIHSSIYNCDLCDFLTGSSDALVKHVIYRHSDKRPFPCQFCDMRFKFKRDLRQHLFIHNSESKYKCQECGFAARTSDTLQHHNRKVHQNVDRVFACHLCQTSCSRGNNLSRHLTAAHGLSPPPGMVRFKYEQDPSDGNFRMVEKNVLNQQGSE